jgi:cytochrome c biogenesis protein CcdA/thiol-disulfide isomerase/thioredoxin
MLVLVPIAFAAGIITAFTPCILPILPIVLAGGGTGTTRRPYAIVAGLVTTFTAFVLAGAWIWSLIGVDKKYQLKIGAVLLLVVALTLVVPQIGRTLERPFLFLTRRRAGDLGGGFFLGASLGLVFVPCGGPVLAAVTANVGSHAVNGWTFGAALAYALGAALPMLLIAQGSRRVGESLRRHARVVHVVAAVFLTASAFVIYDPFHKQWAERLQTKVPAYASRLQGWIEGNGTADGQLASLRGSEKRRGSIRVKPLPRLSVASQRIKVPLNDYGAAPDLHGISAWINTSGLSMSALRGKVVLVDFWTYSCINCLRTLPYIESWDERYRAKGLVILGVHTPEFAFEHDLGNVRAAVERLGISYPVALDNDYDTWDAYGNKYWPADYLVDQAGRVRHIHVGEGDYDETEHDIRLLLEAGGSGPLPPEARQPDRTPTELRTPESYLGYFRIEGYAGSPLEADRSATYRFPRTLARDNFAYSGVWTVESERIVAGRDARLRLHFHARKVYLVLGGHGAVGVTLNGRVRGTIRVNGDRLYTLVARNRARDGLLELSFTPETTAYAFTFG